MESKKEEKLAMYKQFKQSALTKQEMMRYIGVLISMSVNSVRSYRQAWNPKSLQVSIMSLAECIMSVVECIGFQCEMEVTIV